MYCNNKFNAERSNQNGQVLAEAIVVMLMLVLLFGAVHLSGRLQFKWAGQWLNAQIAADALALDHGDLPPNTQVSMGPGSAWRNWVMRDFSVGESHWQAITSNGQFAQTAWRLSGAGQASLDKAVVAGIKQAPIMWRQSEVTSKAVVYALMPTIKAVEAPWDDRGPATEWLDLWQGATPNNYLRSVR